MKYTKITTLILFLTFLTYTFLGSKFSNIRILPGIVKTVQAEDDEHEEEQEEEHNEEERRDEDHEVRYETVTEEAGNVILVPEGEIVSSEPEYKLVSVVDPGFDVDTDKDGLVDALDPNPTVPQQLFFTDTDKDGVADANDEYPGDDDFKYVEFEDINTNGILDSFETLL